MLGQTEKARGARSGKLALLSLIFFRAFSGRFSKYSFRKTLLHAQKVNSQPKAESMIYTFNHSAKDSKKTKQLLTEML